ncbi:MAG TPA: endo-1,4-beta-xylanase [Saprospiraceae bacterium]|nr:endo-1,4-beta-xylanase [Saprospiraceae bacterium]
MTTRITSLFTVVFIFNISILFSQNDTEPIAQSHSKFLGNIYSPPQISQFTQYWNQVTPENAGKWGSVERIRNEMNWTALDAAYKLAKDNGFPFRFHVLIWGNQQPDWIENLDQFEQLDEIQEWFSLVAERYPDIDYLEVVNEPIHDPPNQPGEGGGNYMNAMGGTGGTGWDWVIYAFQLARQHFPNAKLMINEYNIINNANNIATYRQIIRELKNRNLIDGIGVQGHAFSTTVASSVIKANLDLLAEENLPIQITEMDIDGPTDEIQLNEYKRIFPILWEHPAVEGITLWGWRPGLWRQQQRAYLINDDGSERPALVWLREYVESTTSTSFEDKKKSRLNIFPNPARKTSFVSVHGLDETVKNVKLFSIGGMQIHNIPFNGKSLDMSATYIKPGLSLIFFETESGRVITEKILIINE